MGNTGVASQPIFYLFIAASLLLSLGYVWGTRRNRKIIRTTFDALMEVIKPKDQQFTNIGGLSGYHANLVPHRNRYIRRVDVTMTLLPRQSWLYLPFSWLIRRFDRMFMVFYLAPQAAGTLKEGHIIEKGYSRFHGAKIEHAAELNSETIQWGGKTFFLYWEDTQTREALDRCMNMLSEPGPVRHVALVPEEDRIFLFMIPKPKLVRSTVSTVQNWFTQLLGTRVSAGASLE